MKVSLLRCLSLALSAYYCLALLPEPPSADGGIDLGLYGTRGVDLPFSLRSPRDLGGRKWVKRDGHLYELVSNALFENHELRISEPDLCDPSVKQYSGYLDISKDKHLFFWFFEARESPEDAPVILWLNGGPGCSSSTGLLFENGPCTIADDGDSTVPNPYSWNNHFNVIYLDQPVNVGFSYADKGAKEVSNSQAGGKDVYAFLQLFFGRFKEYADSPFHLAGESYAGIYIPNFATEIYQRNKQLQRRDNTSGPLKLINLTSLIIVNGLTDPLVQYASTVDYICDNPYPGVFNSTECEEVKEAAPECTALIQKCYNSPSTKVCLEAHRDCDANLLEPPLAAAQVNIYDVRQKCDREKTPLCYKELDWIERFMNAPENKKALGANPNKNFTSFNLAVNEEFAVTGEAMKNTTVALLPELVDGGIRLLVMAGNADAVCNYLGNQRWVEKLPTQFLDEYSGFSFIPWMTSNGTILSGELRTAGGNGSTAGNITYVTVCEAGHMVPHDQPKASLELVERWINNVPLETRGNSTQA